MSERKASRGHSGLAVSTPLIVRNAGVSPTANPESAVLSTPKNPVRGHSGPAVSTPLIVRNAGVSPTAKPVVREFLNRTPRWLLLVALATALISCGGKPKSAEMKSAPAQYKVLLQTTKGNVLILVHRDWSPLGADHFYELTKMGFYNDNRFFRALKGFIVQWGMNGDPKINKDWSEIPIKDDPPKVSNKTGTVVFAAAGPNSRTTQCFINLGDNSASLDPQGFTPFGEVIQGMDNVVSFYTEYGEGAPNGAGPSQAAIADIGTPYLEEHFPHLDIIKKATIQP